VSGRSVSRIEFSLQGGIHDYRGLRQKNIEKAVTKLLKNYPPPMK
jgi:hypothetical protein